MRDYRQRRYDTGRIVRLLWREVAENSDGRDNFEVSDFYVDLLVLGDEGDDVGIGRAVEQLAVTPVEGGIGLA